jgi:catechol 2,3-dioxygenase-like lactoylglutathione lyase family enzyme
VGRTLAGVLRWTGVCLDCAEPLRLAEFYEQLLGWEITQRSADWYQLADPDGGVGLNIQGEDRYQPPVWPEEPGQPGKQLHLEIEVDDVGRAVDHAVACGAIEARWQPPDRDASRLRVMLDPAGHPFCLYDDG